MKQADDFLKGRLRNRFPAGFYLFVLVLSCFCAGYFFSLPTAFASDSCRPEAIERRFESEQGDHLLKLTFPGTGAAVSYGTSSDRADFVFWFAFLPNGDLATSFHGRDTGTPAEKSRWKAEHDRLARWVGEQKNWHACTNLQTTNYQALDWDLLLGTGTSESFIGIGQTMVFLLLGAWPLYFALLIVAFVQRTRRFPKESLIGVGLVALGLAIRLLSSERLPILSASADFTYIRLVTALFEQGLGADVPVTPPYLPAYPVLLYELFRFVARSPEFAFFITTFFGAWTLWPVFRVGKHLSGSRKGGLFAALALACYPTSIYFSNGINLMIPAAFLLAMNFMHFLDGLEKNTWKNHGLYVLSLFLLVHCRSDVMGLAVFVVLIQGFIVWDKHAWSESLRKWPVFLLGAVALIPLILSLGDTAAEYSWHVASTMERFRWAFLVACGLCVGVVLAGRFLPVSKKLDTAIVLFVSLAAVMLLVSTIKHYPGNPLSPQLFTFADTPHTVYYGNAEKIPTGFLTGSLFSFIASPALFPLLMIPLWIFSLWPKRTPEKTTLSVVAILLFSLPFFNKALTSFLQTGIVMAEPARYLLPTSPLIAASIGLGAWNVRERFSGRAGQAVTVVLVAVLLSPLWTNRELLADTRHNPQNQYDFVRKAVDLLPDRAMLLYPSHCIDSTYFDKISRVDDVIDRSVDLIRGVSFFERKEPTLMDWQRFEKEAIPDGSDVYFLRTAGCAYVLSPAAEHPYCQAVNNLSGHSVLLTATVPNRKYSGSEILDVATNVDSLTFSLVRLDTEAARKLQRFVREHREVLGCPADSGK